MKQLKDIATYVSDKIDTKSMNISDYISTDNMLPERGGILPCTTKPKASRVTQYLPGDVLVSNIRPYFKKIWFSNRNGGCSNDVIVFRVLDENISYPKYLYYLLSQDIFFDYMMSGSNGTKMPRGNKKLIPEFTFNEVDIEKQKRIANILSAYDDLIENNQKQIKLLEEATMRLYKEWFLKLRFPGYENTKIVDGVPEGWELTTVKEMGQVITGKTPSTVIAENYGEDIPFVKIPDMHGVIYPLKTEVKLSERGANTQKNKFLPPKSIMVSCIATVGLVCITHEVCQTNQQINSIVLNDEDHLYYMFFKMKGIKSLLEGVGSNGATMTNVNKTKFENIELLKPENEILKKFNNLVEPFFSNILALSKQNEKLKEARDKLLSKLMSGEIEV